MHRGYHVYAPSLSTRFHPLSCSSCFFISFFNLSVHTSLLFYFLPPVSHQVRVSVNSVCRGDLSISLESPAGTVSLLLDTRPNDASTAGLKNWPLMTVHSWGEQPRGIWNLQVREKMSFHCSYAAFFFFSFLFLLQCFIFSYSSYTVATTCLLANVFILNLPGKYGITPVKHRV